MMKRTNRRRAEPVVSIGPVLLARGSQPARGADTERWRVSCLFVVVGEDDPPDLRVDGVSLAVPPRFLHSWGPEKLWRYDFAVPRAPQEGRAGYGFDLSQQRWHFAVPGTAVPPRIAFTSCGGCEDEAEIAAAGLRRNAMWADLLARHRAAPFHLMLMGGDQVYADGMWRNIPDLAPVAGAGVARRARLEPTPTLAAELEAWYLDVYRHGWTQPEAAAMLSSVPVLSMWDDHEIVDGWGSHPAAILSSPLFQSIYGAARRAFTLFQLGMVEDDPPGSKWGVGAGLSQGLILDDLGVLALDLRSERRPDQVLSDATWAALPGWLDRFAGCRHLLLMSSVPLVFPSLALAERVLNLIPGRQRLEDDLRDQWRSPAHREEWTRLVRLLAGFARARRCRVTVLSGEVHVAGAGVIRGQDLAMHQLIASGIVHPPPSAGAVRWLERLARTGERPFDGLTLEMLATAADGSRLLRARNWLGLDFDTVGAMTATWHAEGRGPACVLRIAGL